MKALVLFSLLTAVMLAGRPALDGDDALGAWSLVAGAIAAGAILVGARVNRLPDATSWRLLAAGALLVPAADAVAGLASSAQGESAAWACRAVGAAAIVLALVRLQRRRSRGRDMATLLDAGIVVWGVATTVWLLLGPSFLDASVADRAGATAAAVGAFALLAVVTYLMLDAGLRSFANAAVALGVGGLVAAGILLAAAALTGETGAWGTTTLAAGAVLALGLAVLHPSVTQLAEPPAVVDSRLRGGRIVVLALGASAVAATMLAYAFVPRDGAVVAAVLAGLVLLGLISGRTALIIGGYERFVDREHVLRECAAALVAAEAREAVAAAVTAAAMELAGGPRRALVEVTLGPRPDLSSVTNTVVAGSGAAFDAMRGELRLQGALGSSARHIRSSPPSSSTSGWPACSG